MHMLLPGTGATNLYPSRQLWEIFCQACCQAGRMPEERRRRAEEEARRDKNHSLSGPLAWPLCRKQNISGDAEVLQRGLAQEKGEGMPPTREGAVCPDVVQEETGREDQEDEQEPWPGEAPAFHLAQQFLGQVGEDEAPSPHGSRRWGSSCTAALTTHPRLPSGNQCHLPSSWEDGRAPSTICPRHVLQTSRRRVSSLARAGSKQGQPQSQQGTEMQLLAGTGHHPSRPRTHLAGSIAGSHVLATAGRSCRQLLVGHFEGANRFL